MRVVRIPTPEEGNPYYPLPPDYPTLTPEGQRQARINGCRQWLIKEPYTPAGRRRRGIALVAAVRLFDTYYLHPDPDTGFDPLFYDMPPLPTPQFHWDIVRMWGENPRNVAIAPRGSAKSMTCRKATITRLLTCPSYSITYCTSTNDNAKETGQIIKTQCYENSRIFDDFAQEPEFGGRILPRHGIAPKGTEHFYLNNKARLRSISVESRARGGRPRRFILDDPEYDEKTPDSVDRLFSHMERFVEKVMLPMVMREGSGVDWLATFVTKRHFAWSAIATSTDSLGRTTARNSKFNGWSRLVVRAAYENTDGSLTSCWEDMWPSSLEAKNANPEWAGRISLPEVRDLVGPLVWFSEYQAKPGETGLSTFGELTEEKHGYTLSSIDEAFSINPRKSSTIITWKQRDPSSPSALVERSQQMYEFLADARLFMCIDNSYTHTASSDFKVAMLFALKPDNLLFVLDLWSGQKPESVLITNAFRIADRWRCPLIAPEVVKGAYALYYNLRDHCTTRATKDLGFDHTPTIHPLKVGFASKNQKVATLTTRFEYGLLKLPMSLRLSSPWSNLFHQIEACNLDREDCGLEKDDHIDTLAMSTFIVKGRIASPTPEQPQERDVIKLLREGTLTTPDGTPLILGLDLRSLDRQTFDILMENRANPSQGVSVV